MGRELILFKSEEKKTGSEIASVLRQIAGRIEKGTLTLGRDDDAITLDFPQNMILEIKVEEEEKKYLKRSLEIEIEWIVGEEDQGKLVIA